MIRQVEASEGDIANHIALSPDARTLALGLPQGGVLLVDTETGKPRTRLPTVAGVTAISFAPTQGGPLVVSAGREVTLWHPETGAKQGKLEQVFKVTFCERDGVT
jgi:hypothetical protein